MHTKNKNIDLNDTVSADDVFTDPLTLADAIESIRDNLGITKTEMAEKLGISKAHYGNFTKGLESVSIDRAGEWARKLGYPEKMFIKCALQDMLAKSNYNNLKVSLG